MWGPIQSPEKEGTLPRKLRPMDASPGRYTGPTAILSRFPGRLLDSAIVHVTSFSAALVFGPERGWSIGQGGFVALDVDELAA